jgi:hypothetical protein
MSAQWSAWKTLPAAGRGQGTEAPQQPGLYEVRSAESGRMLAFGHTANLARSLIAPRGEPLWRKLLRRRTWNERLGRRELEFRIWATATTREAREIEQSYQRRRRVFMQNLATSH